MTTDSKPAGVTLSPAVLAVTGMLATGGIGAGAMKMFGPEKVYEMEKTQIVESATGRLKEQSLSTTLNRIQSDINTLRSDVKELKAESDGVPRSIGTVADSVARLCRAFYKSEGVKDRDEIRDNCR